MLEFSFTFLIKKKKKSFHLLTWEVVDVIGGCFVVLSVSLNLLMSIMDLLWGLQCQSEPVMYHYYPLTVNVNIYTNNGIFRI